MEINQIVPFILVFSVVIGFLTVKIARSRQTAPVRVDSRRASAPGYAHRRGALALNPIISCAMPFYDGGH